jgi:hypothetical protein
MNPNVVYIYIYLAISFPKNKKMQEKCYIVTSNNNKKVLDCIKKSKLEKYLCFAI